MAVAIPAQMALAWFDSVVDHLAEDMEDASTRILHAPGLNKRSERVNVGLQAPAAQQFRAAE
jgi:hypothetical protein